MSTLASCIEFTFHENQEFLENEFIKFILSDILQRLHVFLFLNKWIPTDYKITIAHQEKQNKFINISI
jgi:hypothetical protein